MTEEQTNAEHEALMEYIKAEKVIEEMTAGEMLDWDLSFTKHLLGKSAKKFTLTDYFIGELLNLKRNIEHLKKAIGRLKDGASERNMLRLTKDKEIEPRDLAHFAECIERGIDFLIEYSRSIEVKRIEVKRDD